MKAVKFLMAHTIGALFNIGEIAGFEEDVADDLIARKIAEAVKVKTDPKADAKTKAQEAAALKTLTEVEALSDADLEKAIVSEKVKVDATATREAKIAAVVAARSK